MHIVYICSEYPYLGIPTGGFGTYVKNISTAILKKNHDVSVICFGKKSEIIKQDRLWIISLQDSRRFLKQGVLNRIRSFLVYPIRFSWQARIALFTLDRMRQIDVIEGGDFGAELFFYLLLKPKLRAADVIKLHTSSFIIREHNQEPLNAFYLIMEFLEVYCLKRIFSLYSPTKALSLLVRKKINRSLNKVIPYTIIETPFLHSNKENIVLYIGKMQLKKGVYDLIRAIPLILKTLPNTKFYLIGPDTVNKGVSVGNNMRLIVQVLGIANQVKFIKELPISKLKTYYLRSKVCIVPSHWENFPNVILEAGIYGCPVIATNTGGIPEMIKHNQTGLLVPVGNSLQLAKSITYLLQRDNVQTQLAKRLYKHITHAYNPETIGTATENFYFRLVKEKGLAAKDQ